MRLRKQAPAKAAIVALSAALLAVFYGIIHADPRIKAEEASTGPTPTVDYDRFFAPGAPPAQSSQPEPVIPRIRTRAS
ncbi:MAG TPA: hypothetical protein VH951_09845 [Dehalococcoidia bacterium]|jgi:hypothetical protein